MSASRLQAALRRPDASVVALADCLLNRWGSYIRDGSMEEVRGYGTRSAQKVAPPRFGMDPKPSSNWPVV